MEYHVVNNVNDQARITVEPQTFKGQCQFKYLSLFSYILKHVEDIK